MSELVFVQSKWTRHERDLLDWLRFVRGFRSRGDTLRSLVVEDAKRQGIRPAELEQVREGRAAHPPKRRTRYRAKV